MTLRNVLHVESIKNLPRYIDRFSKDKIKTPGYYQLLAKEIVPWNKERTEKLPEKAFTVWEVIGKITDTSIPVKEECYGWILEDGTATTELRDVSIGTYNNGQHATTLAHWLVNIKGEFLYPCERDKETFEKYVELAKKDGNRKRRVSELGPKLWEKYSQRKGELVAFEDDPELAEYLCGVERCQTYNIGKESHSIFIPYYNSFF